MNNIQYQFIRKLGGSFDVVYILHMMIISLLAVGRLIDI